MISKKSVIYRFLCIWWVLNTMAPCNSRFTGAYCNLFGVLHVLLILKLTYKVYCYSY